MLILKSIQEFLKSVELRYGNYRDKIDINSKADRCDSVIKLNKLKSMLERINKDMDLDLVDVESQSIIKKTKTSDILTLLNSGNYSNNTVDINVNKKLGRVVLSVKR